MYISTNFNKPKGATLTKIEPKARASQNKKLLGDLETKIGWVVVAVMKQRSIWWSWLQNRGRDWGGGCETLINWGWCETEVEIGVLERKGWFRDGVDHKQRLIYSDVGCETVIDLGGGLSWNKD